MILKSQNWAKQKMKKNCAMNEKMRDDWMLDGPCGIILEKIYNCKEPIDYYNLFM